MTSRPVFMPPARDRDDLPGPGRARIELRRWPARDDAGVAHAAGTDEETVAGQRAALEQRGEIPVIEPARRTAYPLYPRPPRTCDHCGETFTPVPKRRKGGREQRFCSDACQAAAWNERRREERRQEAQARQPQRRQRTLKSAPMPDFSAGWCVTCPPDKRSLWTSCHPADREAARHMCLDACPCLDACRAWSLALPDHDYAVYGGMRWSERIEAKYADPADWDRRCRELGI